MDEGGRLPASENTSSPPARVLHRGIRAIDIVRLAIEKLGPPIDVRKEIVHNPLGVDEVGPRPDRSPAARGRKEIRQPTDRRLPCLLRTSMAFTQRVCAE